MATLTRDQFLSPEPQNATLGLLSGGAAGIRQTLNYMVSFVKEYRKNPEIRALAERIIFNAPEKDAVAEARAVFEWVRNNIRYTQDIRDVETIKTPDAVLYSQQGDCDDQSLLTATLLETIGYTTRFVAVGTHTPGVFEHVYAQVKLGTRWIALDTTENYPMGWEPPGIVARMERHV